MKKLILILLLISSYCYSQDSRLDIGMLQQQADRSGTCSSPDGVDKVIASPPSDYNYLNNNGYCTAVSPAVKDFVGCYTMTAGATSVDFNAGYNTTGCTGLIINYAILYTTAGCVVVDGTAIGVSSGLTIGTNYTWCISLKCTGPGPGFSSFCPYYQNITALPIELTEFKCITENDDIQLKWITSSETNNDYFTIYRSNNALKFDKIGVIKGNGTTSMQTSYIFYDYFPDTGTNYYKISQTDYNGVTTKSYIIDCLFSNKVYEVIYYNMLGKEVDIDEVNSGLYLRMLINNDHYKIDKYWKL